MMFFICFRPLSIVFQEKVVTLRQKQEYMKNSIIGRKEEIALLEKYMTSNHSEFIVIYGRRRVGKTFLIRHYFQKRFAFDMTGIIEGKKVEQLTAFNHAMKQYGTKAGNLRHGWTRS